MGPILHRWANELEKHEDNIIPVLIYLVGLSLIIDTAIELKCDILDYKQYQFIFQWMPPQTIFLRYCYSIILRCVIIAIVAGVCLRKEIFRKALIVIVWWGVITLFWKHPYQAIVNANIYSYSHANMDNFSQTIRLPWASHQEFYPMLLSKTMAEYVQDLVKAALILSFFSFPSVRKFFR